MAYKLLLPDYFEEQVNELFEFYELRKKGWGIKFLIELDECLENILDNPSRWQFLHTRKEGIRRGLTAKSTPQAIILYKVEGEQIYITNLKDSKSDWK